VLQNAGFRLDHRRRWAEARALYIQLSLAPQPERVLRIFSVEPARSSAACPACRRACM